MVERAEGLPERSALCSLLAAAGRFRPTTRLAKGALRALRTRNLIPKHVAGSLNGRRILLDLDEDVDTKIFLFGAFDERGLKLIERFARAVRCRTAIDVGANIGNHTGFLCGWAKRVYSFEPNPPTYARLQRFVSSSGLSNVTVFPYGLSNHDGELLLYTFPGAAGLATFEPSDGALPAQTISVRSGDSIIRERAIKDIDIIKIDAQEHEYEVLEGLQDTIGKHQPILFVEFFGKSMIKLSDPQSLRAVLPGYRLFGTGKGAMSTVFKTALRLEAFVSGKHYDHVVCIPEQRIDLLRAMGETRK